MNPMDLFSPDSGMEGLIIGLAGLAAFINVFLLYRVMLERNPRGPRIKVINQRIHELREGITRPRARRHERRTNSIGFIRQVVASLHLLRTREAKKVTLKLMRAGWRSRDALNIYFFLKLSLPFAFGIAALFLLYVLTLFDLESTVRMLTALGAVVVGAYGPEIVVHNVTSKRRKLLQKGLPDTLDLLVICAESGQSLDGALARVARELGVSHPELAEELHLTSAELGLLPDRRQALENLNQRTDLPGIRAVVNTLFQSEKYGTPLSQSLRVLATEFRNDRMMRAETKAARLPAILTVPMILSILPPLFIVLIGPAIIKALDNFARIG
jgi:tight adherence protein C